MSLPLILVFAWFAITYNFLTTSTEKKQAALVESYEINIQWVILILQQMYLSKNKYFQNLWILKFYYVTK